MNDIWVLNPWHTVVKWQNIGPGDVTMECIVDQIWPKRYGCLCANKRVIKDDIYQGNCLTEYNGNFWCYVQDNSQCCQGRSDIPGYCINFDLCNTDYADGEADE